MASISQPSQYYFNIFYQDALRALTNSFVQIPVQIQGSTVAVPVTGSLDVSVISPNPVPITGSVIASNLQNPQPITGNVNVSNLLNPQPITGDVNVANLQNPMPITGGPYALDQRLGAIYSQLSPSNTNLFANNLIIPAFGDIIATFSSNTTTSLYLVDIPSGQTAAQINQLTNVNPNNTVYPNTWYQYQFRVGAGDAINFQQQATGTINLYVDFQAI